jgi:hypothetical protein
MPWQAETFEVVKSNLYSSLGQLATVMDDKHLDFLFKRFESARSRPLPDTLRLFELLQRLVLSDTRVRTRSSADKHLLSLPRSPSMRQQTQANYCHGVATPLRTILILC